MDLKHERPLLGWICGLTVLAHSMVVPDNKLHAAETPATPVQVEVIASSPIVKEIELTGTVTSPNVSQISTSIAGLIEEVKFDSGAVVKRDDVLAQLDDELELATLTELTAKSKQAQTEASDAARRLEIAKNLAERKIGPQNTADDRLAELESKRAALESARAAEKRQSVVIKRHTIKAPFDGVISQRMGEVGEWIEPGNPLFELVALKELRVDVPVPQQFYEAINRETDVSLTFETLSGAPQSARVDVLIPVNDPDARTFTLRVLPQDNALPITPGMSARVLLKLKAGQTGTVVSRDALIRHPDGRITAWVTEKGDKATAVKERLIKIGHSFNGLVHVVSGLKEGERVVVRGNEALREGQAVRITN